MKGRILKKLGVIFMVLVLSLSYVGAQSGSPKNWGTKNSKTELKELVESRSFLFKAQYAYKRSGQKLELSNGYDLRVDYNFAACWLPSLDIVTGFRSDLAVEPLQFRESIDNVAVQFDNRSSNYFVDFNVQPSGNMMHFQMQILPDGKATLMVYFANRESIRIEGFVDDINSRKSI